MGIAERLQTFISARPRLPWRRKQVATHLWSTWKTWNVVTGEGDFAQLSQNYYEKNALIYSCIEELATSSSEPELLVETKQKGDWETAEDHALAELLSRPNPRMTAYEMWHGVMMYEAIAGNMYYEKERAGSGRVVALWPVRPDRVKARVERQGNRNEIRGWEIALASGEVLAFDPEDIIQFKTSHPRSDVYGLAPLSVCLRMAGIDNSQTDYISAFFNNAAVPFGMLTVKQVLDEAEIERIRTRFRQQYTGLEGWHNMMVLDEAEANYEQLGLAPGEIEIKTIRDISEARICGVFQVPPMVVDALVGMAHATYSNKQEARKGFWQETLMPIYRRHADVINLQLAPEFGDDVRVRWDFGSVIALREETTALHDRVRSDFMAGYVTVNEARQRIGVEPVVGGDIFLRPIQLMPTEAVPETPKGFMAKGSVQLFRVRSDIVPSLQVTNTGGMEYIWWKSLDMTAKAWEESFEKAAKRRFREDSDELLKLLRQIGKASKAAVPFQAFEHSAQEYLELQAQKEWRREFIPLFRALTEAQGENIAAAWGISFDVDQPEVFQFIEQYTMKFSEGLYEVDAGAMSKLVGKAQEEGWSVPELRNAIMETWDNNDRVRATDIARSETIRSSNAGAKQAMTNAGVRIVSWLASPDDGRRCVWCGELDGRKISVERNFFEVGEEFVVVDGAGKQHAMKITYTAVGYPPLHTKCRCTIKAEFEEV